MNCLNRLSQLNFIGVVLMLALFGVFGCAGQPVAAVIDTPTTTPTIRPTAEPTATRTPTRPSTTPTPTATSTSTLTPHSPTATATVAASPTPTLTPAPPTATPTPRPPVENTVSYTITVTLPTYPFKKFLFEQVDPVYNMPVFYFNRPEYEAKPRQPEPIDYTGVVLENKYLRLTFLPELGGRLYSAVTKATGQEIFYHNPVVKPSRYGVLQPYEANWWLATGGMEWAYPVQEHGYRFGVPWAYRVAQNRAGATITLSDTAANRTGLEVTISLPDDSASFTVTPKLTNNTEASIPTQLWTNAALTLTPGSMSPDTRFVVPTQVITIHSRGELGWTIPASGEPAPWPQVGDTDLRDYRQWANYLGFFVSNAEASFVGAYNAATKLGVVRLPAGGKAGKVFAFSTTFTDRSYTDDDSQYFEIWGGANAGFWANEDIPVSPGQSLGWTERWWPLVGLPGLTWATDRVAIALETSAGRRTLSALVSQPTTGRVKVVAANATLVNESFSASPDTPLVWRFAADSPLHIEFTDAAGQPLLIYPSN